MYFCVPKTQWEKLVFNIAPLQKRSDVHSHKRYNYKYLDFITHSK